METAMASETNPSALTPTGPALATSTQQATAQVTPKSEAKSPAPKSATRTGQARRKATGKKLVASKKSKNDAASKSKKDGKRKKVKMVRDSYTMPENDYAKLAELKKTCLKAGVHVKKSELLRAGLNSLSKLPTATLLKTVEDLVKIKTGRPGKH
jgi:hypothetical protein